MRVAIKGRRAGQQFVEQHTQRVDVAARIDVQADSAVACSGLMYIGVPTICENCVNNVCVGQACRVALATPKSITFGTALIVAPSTSTLDGLRSRWMIAFLMRVLNRWQHRDQTAPAAARVSSWSASQYSVIGMPLTNSITK